MESRFSPLTAVMLEALKLVPEDWAAPPRGFIFRGRMVYSPLSNQTFNSLYHRGFIEWRGAPGSRMWRLNPNPQELDEGPARLCPKQAILELACQKFNEDFPVGTLMRAWPGALHSGRSVTGAVLEPGATVLSGHTAVVYIEGVSGCLALTNVEPIDPA